LEYRAVGINLKRQPLGEADWLLHILTREKGVVRLIAKGGRKSRSKLGGRSELFVVNDLHIARGRSIDRIMQAESLHLYTGLTKDLTRLTCAQYLTEAVLAEASQGQPHAELFDLLLAQLGILETVPESELCAHLVHSLFQVLHAAGIAPDVTHCVLTRQPIREQSCGFSVEHGGVVALRDSLNTSEFYRLTPNMLKALQMLSSEPLTEYKLDHSVWKQLERFLRHYLEHHLERSLRSAQLLETLWPPAPVLPRRTFEKVT
jgi:DNA repair protein RecO (recombination protein O)